MPDTTQQPLFGAPATSPASLANRRALAMELMKQGMSTDPIRSPWQGVGRIAQAMVGGYEASQSDKSEQDARAKLLADALNARGTGDPGKMLGTALNPFTPEKAAAEMAGRSFPGNVDTGLTVQPQSGITGQPAAPAIPKQIVTQQGAEGVHGPAVVTPQDLAPGAPAAAPRQPPAIGGPVNPLSVNGQPQNLTGPIIPPGGSRGGPGAPAPAPSSLLTPQGLDALAAKGREIAARRSQQDSQMAGIKQDVDAAHAAPGQIGALNVIEDVMRTSPPTTGAAAESILKLKQTVNGIVGRDVMGDTAPAEVVKKMNTYLAAEVSKAMSSRGATQFDFATQMGNMPGNLMNSPKGTLVLASILKQVYRQNLELGRQASTTQDYGGWTNARTQFFDKNPIINPLDNKPMGTSRDTPEQQGTADREGWTIIDGVRIRRAQ